MKFAILCKSGNADKLRTVVDGDATKFEDLGSGMYGAAMMGHVECLAILLDAGAHVDSTDTEGDTALHAASHHNKCDVARFLVERGATVNATNLKQVSRARARSRSRARTPPVDRRRPS